MPIDPQEWNAVQSLLERLLDLPPGQRRERLARSSAEPAIKQQVASLLDALEQSPDYLETSAVVGEAAPERTGSLAAGTHIGPWRVLGLIGRGGMGEVYRAERDDGSYTLDVAIKLVSPDAVAHIERFHNERQILASLDHPGIARLLDGGVHGDGRPYMVMELVVGEDLAAYCHAHQLLLEARLHLFRQICETVRYAHSRMVVHRDLKPRNILVTPQGQVKLLDFGVARMLDGDSARTQTLLTPEYASPEQLEGGPLNLATDVYALGLLLYELLVGVSVWGRQGSQIPTLVRRILEGEVPVPSRAAAQLPESPPVPPRLIRGDLDAIVLKALRREPGLRYETVGLLLDELQRHQQGQPVQARGADRGYLLRRFLRRHRVVASAAALVVLAGLAGLAGILWQAHLTRIERDIARSEAARVTAVRDYLSLMLRNSAKAESDGVALTSRELLRRSAEDIETGFEGDVEARLEVIKVLAHLSASTGDSVGSAELLETYLKQGHAVLSPGSIAEAQFNLAQQKYRFGELTAARQLLDAAQSTWNTAPQRFRKVLTQSLGLQADLLQDAGETEAAIEVMRRALAETREEFGAVGQSTINSYTRLGTLLVQQAHAAEAQALLAQAWTALGEAGRQDSREGHSLLAAMGLAALANGDPAKAEALQREHVDRSRRVYGDSMWLAGGLANLGHTLLREGRPAQARPVLEEAQSMARSSAGENNPVELLARIHLAEAIAQLGEVEEAQSRITDLRTLIEQRFGRRQRLYVLARLAEVRIRQARGDAAATRRLFVEVQHELLEQSAPAPLYRQALLQLDAETRAAVSEPDS